MTFWFWTQRISWFYLHWITKLSDIS